jgi:hypothetical protein
VWTITKLHLDLIEVKEGVFDPQLSHTRSLLLLLSLGERESATCR